MFSNRYDGGTPDQLRTLVLDYLCHSYYTRTAQAFSRDSSIRHLDADGDEILTSPTTKTPGYHSRHSGTARDSGEGIDDEEKATPETLVLTGTDNQERRLERLLKQILVRKEIRRLILSGLVEDAIMILDRYFPSVLNTSVSGTNDASDDLHSTPTSSSPSANNSIEYLSSTSTEPAHLLLNLRILAFCEACRTIPLPPPGSSPAGATPRSNVSPRTASTSDVEKTGAVKWGQSQEGDEEEASGSEDTMSETSDPEYEIEQQQLALLTRARKLYAFTDTLPNALDRATYHKELENVAGLLAYQVPEESPMSKYLSMERREAVADQINRAILKRTGLPLMSSLEVLIRNLHLVWDYAHQLGIKARPDAVIPPRAPTKSAQSQSQDPNDNVVPPFDLRQFLDSKP